MFEIHLVAGASTDLLLSDEVKRETNAQVMTLEEARKVGFGGLPDLGPLVRLIAVNKRDAGWIHKLLEGSPSVQAFHVHYVD